MNFNMILTQRQYENLSKEELIQKLADFNSSFVSDMNIKLSKRGEGLDR